MDGILLPFHDRSAGGRALAELLAGYADRTDVIVLGLPRGGVPVAFEVARALATPLDVFIVRKLGVPGHEELAMGAIASGDVRVLNHDVLRELRIHDEVIEKVAAHEREELFRRERLYRGNRSALDVHGKIAILVDDGVATGSSMLAAVQAVREQDPARIVVGVPIASSEACAALEDEADEIHCAATPYPFYAVGHWYRNFAQVSDDEVGQLLRQAAFERSNS